MNLLRHMAVDYVLHQLSGDRRRPAAFSARPRPSVFDAVWEATQASGPLGTRGRESAVRASDAEREEVVASLKRHYAEGRLDTDELTARVESAYGARRLNELAALTRDLPATPSPAVAPPARPRRTTRPGVGAAGLVLSAFLIVALLTVLPAEFWAPLLMLIIPLATFALFAIVPLALFAIPLIWMLRGPREHHRIGPGHGRNSIASRPERGWVSIRRF